MFFGKPAATALSAAELSLKYDAPLIPIYGVRQPNGLDFKIIVEEPVPPSDAVTMTQALNDSLEALVREHPEQWLWMHRRWKPEVIERQRKRAAARMRPGPRA
jgi:KDO2-lipid IV(A) lauroyltransferase